MSIYKPNNKMTLDEIHEVSADISNTLWHMRKNGELNHLSEEEFDSLRETIGDFYTGIGWALMGWVPKKDEGTNE